MKKVIGILVAMVLLLLAVTVAGAAGQTSDQLANAGWHCEPLPPNGWQHCFSPSFDFPGDFSAGKPTIQVKVFDGPGTTFLGTELLVRADLYQKGQPPCPQDGGDYEPVVDGAYMACHHFDTTSH